MEILEAKLDLRGAEIRLAEHMMSSEPLDLSIGYAVTFAGSRLVCALEAAEIRRTWEKPWWFKGTVEK